MHTPRHHLDDADLSAYAAGIADDAEAVLIATHLALCPTCRHTSDTLDALGGAMAFDSEPAAPQASLESILAQLDMPQTPPKPLPHAGANDIPMPLRGYTGPLAKVPFRTVAPGIRRFDLPMSSKGRPVALVALRPGLVVPPHRHSATERGLVLQGGFTDETGHFERGDVSIRGPDEAQPHDQRIDLGVDCIVLMVDDGPKVPTTMMGHVVNTLFGL